MRGSVSTARRARPRRKRPERYHHGDLRQALLHATLHTIQRQGVDSVTLRGVADSLGVSRSAMYRHFADKSALLAAVAGQGFRMLRVALVDACERAGRGRPGFEAMGAAYVAFAVANPAHYRVMFGGGLATRDDDLELNDEGTAAFRVLVEAIVEQQRDGLVRPDDAQQLACYVWGAVHGIAMLAIDGLLGHQQVDVTALTRFAVERLRTGISS
jgi:AcrR family transcriptional regulator